MRKLSTRPSRYPGVHCVRQDNQGLSGARNAGFRESKGSNLVFLDADDRLLPEALEVGVECLEAHPECAFVSGHYKGIAADGSPLPTPEQPHIEKEHYLEILRCNYRTTPAVVMFQRAIFESVGGFDTAWSHSEDADLCLRIARRFPVRCHGKVVAEYRIHGSSWSHNYESMLKASTAVRRSQRKHVKGNKRLEEAVKSGVRTSQDYYGVLLAYQVLSRVQKREWKRAIRGMMVLLRYYPRVFVRVWQKLGLLRRLQRWLRLT